MTGQIPGDVAGSPQARDLADRLFSASVGTLDLFGVYLGERLGLYRAMRGREWVTPAILAERTGTRERLVREWLEHQAASAIVDVRDPNAAPAEREFRLPTGHADVLADEDNLLYSSPRAVELARAARLLPQLVDVFRTEGTGLPPTPWEPEGRGEYNRAIYLRLLGQEWLPGVPDLDRRLRADPPARVADLACGTGWSSIAMAQAYPRIRVHGFDLDEDVIRLAAGNAEAEGLADRVSFEVRDIATMADAGPFDLVTIIEAFHDLAHPVEVLRAVRASLAADGSVLIGDEEVAERFTAPADETERYVYGWSVMGCLPSAMGEPGTAATGAAMRPDTVREYARAAGFGSVEIVPIGEGFWRFYRLTP
jgi:2-polyprenyl-3-methyl-5-hydroxy-6-metoxy-1,4-benzoquinol methylase